MFPLIIVNFANIYVMDGSCIISLVIYTKQAMAWVIFNYGSCRNKTGRVFVSITGAMTTCCCCI